VTLNGGRRLDPKDHPASGSFRPNGVYLDDGLSGVAVLRNLFVNVPGSAVAVSGRDLSADLADIEKPEFRGQRRGGQHIVGVNKPEYDKGVLRFSEIGPNGAHGVARMNALFADAAKGDYSVRPSSRVYKDFPAWEDIPLGQIGRVVRTTSR
jgi:hypothetical protein